MSFSLCRRLPTEHVSGHLQFKVELTSTGPDGTPVYDFISPSFSLFSFNIHLHPPALGASPDSIIGISSLNGAPGTPSDDEDLPHPLPGVVPAGASPTSSQGSQGMWEGGATALPEKELPAVRAGTRFVQPVMFSDQTMLQRSLSEGLDAIEAPKGPGERPLGAASPKLCSSFPTHTRLSDMLHIDSDEDEERSGMIDVAPLPLSPLLLNGVALDVGGPDEDDLIPDQPECSVQEEETEMEEEAEVDPDLEPDLDLDDVLEQDVFLEAEEELPVTEVVTHPTLVEGAAATEQGRGAAEEVSSDINTCSMATAPQTAFSSSESCPITLTTATVCYSLKGS